MDLMGDSISCIIYGCISIRSLVSLIPEELLCTIENLRRRKKLYRAYRDLSPLRNPTKRFELASYDVLIIHIYSLRKGRVF